MSRAIRETPRGAIIAAALVAAALPGAHGQLLSYVNGCTGQNVAYNQGLAGTAFGLPNPGGNCGFRGYMAAAEPTTAATITTDQYTTDPTKSFTRCVPNR